MKMSESRTDRIWLRANCIFAATSKLKATIERLEKRPFVRRKPVSKVIKGVQGLVVETCRCDRGCRPLPGAEVRPPRQLAQQNSSGSAQDGIKRTHIFRLSRFHQQREK